MPFETSTLPARVIVDAVAVMASFANVSVGSVAPDWLNVQTIDASVLFPQVRSLSSVESKDSVTLPDELDDVIPVPPVNVTVLVELTFVELLPSVSVQYW